MEYESKQKSYQRAVRIDNRPQTTKTAPLHAPTVLHTHTHTLLTYEEQKEHTKFTKEILENTDWSRQRKQMSFFASSLYFFITHSYFEQTRKKTLLSSNVWFLTHNKSRVIFIYPADNWLFIYIYECDVWIDPDWRLLEQKNVRRPFYVLFVSTVKLVIFDLTALYKLYSLIDEIFFSS